MRRSNLRTWAGLVVLVAAAPVPAAEPFSEMLRRVPESANALLLIDVAALNSSPLGLREGWAKDRDKASLGVAGGLPPSVQRLVVAARISPTTLDHAWKVGIAATRSAITPEQLGRNEGGIADTVAAHPTVLSPRNAYYTILAPQLVGMMCPADRQALSHWLRSMPAGHGPERYLADAAATSAPIVLAADTTDVFDAPGLRSKFGKVKFLAGRGDLAQIVQAVAGLKGVRLAVSVGDTLTGELRLDTDAADQLAPVAKSLVQEALGTMGLEVDDLEKWTVRPAGAAVILSGPLTERGLRLLLSPLLSPTMAPALSSGAASAGETKGQAAVSLRYFRSVNKLLDDLRQQKTKTYVASARAYKQYAQQIDELPILGVDADLLKWGGDVSATLRGLATLAKTTLGQRNIAAMNYYRTLSQGNYTTWDAWGYGYNIIPAGTNVDTGAVAQINNLIGTAGANEVEVRSLTWNNIENVTGQVRRKMTEKYQMEF